MFFADQVDQLFDVFPTRHPLQSIPPSVTDFPSFCYHGLALGSRVGHLGKENVKEQKNKKALSSEGDLNPHSVISTCGFYLPL